jgi:hypothetical protein
MISDLPTLGSNELVLLTSTVFLFAYNWKRGDEVPVSKFEVGGGLKLEDVFEADLTEIYKGSKNHHLKEIARKSGVDLKVGLRRRHITPYTILQVCDV